ncbi:hypothetical protein H0264_33160 [Nocardia huaxiensis]|uniref:Uncharacterized protein n=1 Tax=Nocardia huaxiensis TaxID=2755382 RepID=A0A7D6ZHQ1_9NOCA|nr:hypothetical protein [Nocardia huaxiensis]QLY30000.1 hypothetical protein H0264_33160 [Nocardia huaxiensis]
MARESGPRQVQLIGPVGGGFTYLLAAAMMLVGPVSGAFGESLGDALCAGVFTFPLGIALAFSAFEWRASARRFDAVGVRGTAEIVAVKRVRGGGEEERKVELIVRISGGGFDAFEAECEVGARDPLQVVGERFDVMVDPEERTFAVGFDHLFPRDSPGNG